MFEPTKLGHSLDRDNFFLPLYAFHKCKQILSLI